MLKKTLIVSAMTLAVAPTLGYSAALEEVVVTAQKRAQSINDVGMSISAVSGDSLKDMGITDVGDLVKVTPGLTFTTSQNGTPLFTLRGVGFNDYTLGASPAVSVYVNEVPLVYGAFTKGVSMDLDRVEVLKGPQGLLFGQNSTGGAINYIAAKPTQEFEAGVSASYGRFNRLEADAYVSGGLSDSLSGRIAVATTQSDEWQKSTTRNDELGAEDVFKMRAQLLWEPSEDTTVLLGVNGWTDKSDTQASQLQGLALQIADPATALIADVPETLSRITAFQALTPAGNDARSADWDAGRQLDRDDSFVQMTMRVDIDLTETISLTSISAYSEFDEDYSMDRDGTPLINAGIDSVGSVETFTQELRIQSSSDTMSWLVGLNYATNDVSSEETILTGDSTNTAILPGGPFIGTATSTLTQDIEDVGLFANVEYNLSEALTLLVGARYAESKNDSAACMRKGGPGMLATFPFFSDVLRGIAPGTTTATATDCLSLNGTTLEMDKVPFLASLNEDNVSWRVGLNLNATDNLLVYGLVSEGYKTGSFPLLPASTTAQYSAVTQESVLAYELGFKWTLPEQSMQLNGAVFNYDYEDKQVRGIIKDPIFNQLDRLVNIPKSTIRGVEIELVWSPIDGLLTRLSGTFVDTEVKEFYKFTNAGVLEDGINGARVQGDFSGSALPFTPENHIVADVEYRWGISDDLEAFMGVNVLYNSDANSTFGDPQSTRIDAFTTVDLRAGVSDPDGKWSASVWGRNVTDEYYWTNQYFTQDVITRFAAKPATYGATVSYNF